MWCLQTKALYLFLCFLCIYVFCADDYNNFQETMKTAAQAINYNGKIDNGTLKTDQNMSTDFVKNFEKFLSICDLIELNLVSFLD